MLNLYKLYSNPDELTGYKDRMRLPWYAFKYGKETGDWNREIKRAIAKHPETAYDYAFFIDEPFYEGEKAISESPKYSYLYATHVLHADFAEGEKAISKYPSWSFHYAKDVIEGRFYRGEAAIATHSYYAYLYASQVLDNRFPQGEEAIFSDPSLSITYRQFIRGIGDDVTEAISESDDHRDELFQRTADAQRDLPERIMVGLQSKMGGGVYSVVMEHVGDITHRMSDHFSKIQGQQENVREKVLRGFKYLNHPYGFEKEMQQNMRNNYNYYIEEKGMTKSFNEWANEIKEGCKRYAKAHQKIPVWNEPQLWAREAAVAIGLWDFDTARLYLEKLKKITDLPKDQYIEAVGQMTLTEAKPKNPGFDFMLKTKWSSMDTTIEEWMKKQGFKSIGEGAYANVYQHPSAKNQIVKVVDVQDRCFLAYLRYVIKNQSNPHVPRYHGAKQIPLNVLDKEEGPVDYMPQRRRFFVILETLSELPLMIDWDKHIKWKNDQESYWNFCALIYMTLIRYSHDYFIKFSQRIPQIHQDLPFYGSPFAKELNLFTNYGTTVGLEKSKEAVRALSKVGENVVKRKKTLFGKTINDVRRNIPSYCITDLHLGNVMIRSGDGQLVITDPYAETVEVY